MWKELHRNKKWIPRKYETRRIKILHREFREIERLMHVSHVSVINWVKKSAEELRRVEEKGWKRNRSIRTGWNVYKLKNIWLWTAVDRESKKLLGY